MMNLPISRTWPGATALALLVLTGCGADGQTGGEAPAADTPTVAITVLKASPLTVHDVLPGRVEAVRVAEIRPQISGIVQKRLFEQGAEVRAGQPLFAINAAPFRAEAAMAAAALERAVAVLAHAQSQVARLQPLAQARAISQQSYDEAVSQQQQAAADVSQAQATYERRKLDVSFATVQAPIAGRVDQALQTEGALVSSTDTTPMARVVQIDQVYVDVRQPVQAMAALRQQLQQHQPARGERPGLPVTVLQPNGNPFDLDARVLFSGMSVDSGTGDGLLRVLVANPRRELLPGMFVQTRVPVATYATALMVPEEAVVRSGGKPQVWSVTPDGTTRGVPVVLGELVDRQYRIASGLNAGDRIVVSGMDRLSDGLKVRFTESATASDSSPQPAARAIALPTAPPTAQSSTLPTAPSAQAPTAAQPATP